MLQCRSMTFASFQQVCNSSDKIEEIYANGMLQLNDECVSYLLESIQSHTLLPNIKIIDFAGCKNISKEIKVKLQEKITSNQLNRQFYQLQVPLEEKML